MIIELESKISYKHKLKSVFLLCFAIMIGCNNPTCIGYIDSYFRNKKIDLVIQEKHDKTKSYVIIGNNTKDGIKDTLDYFEITKIIYDLAEIGDTIKKIGGETEIYLYKVDTIIEFPCICNGKIIK